MATINCVIFGQTAINSVICEYLKELVEANGKFSNPLQLYLIDLYDCQFSKDLTFLSYLNVDIFLICFSVMDLKVFANIQTYLMPTIREFYYKIPIALIGTEAFLEEEINGLGSAVKQRSPITYLQGWCMAFAIGAMVYKEFSSMEYDDLEAILELAIECVKQERSMKSQRKITECISKCSIM